MDIYVVVLHDRHCDDDIELCTDHGSAMRQVRNFKSQYENEGWAEELVVGWLYYAASKHDGGPSIHVEKHTVHGIKLRR